MPEPIPNNPAPNESSSNWTLHYSIISASPLVISLDGVWLPLPADARKSLSLRYALPGDNKIGISRCRSLWDQFLSLVWSRIKRSNGGE